MNAKPVGIASEMNSLTFFRAHTIYFFVASAAKLCWPNELVVARCHARRAYKSRLLLDWLELVVGIGDVDAWAAVAIFVCTRVDEFCSAAQLVAKKCRHIVVFDALFISSDGLEQ